MPVAVYTCNLEGEIDFYNDAAVELWGRKPLKNKDRLCGSLRRYNNKGEFVPHEKYLVLFLEFLPSFSK